MFLNVGTGGVVLRGFATGRDGDADGTSVAVEVFLLDGALYDEVTARRQVEGSDGSLTLALRGEGVLAARREGDYLALRVYQEEVGRLIQCQTTLRVTKIPQ
jgi:hypothetical protein